MLPPLFLLFFVLNITDWYTTHLLLGQTGFTEGNPLMSVIFGFGSFSALLFKFLIISIIYLVVQRISWRSFKTAKYTLVFLNLMYIFIVANNLAYIIRGW